MTPILLYHTFKATTPFVDTFVNERLQQLLPTSNDCLPASSRSRNFQTDVNGSIVNAFYLVVASIR